MLTVFLSDPEIRDEAASIGVNLEETRVGQHILMAYCRLVCRAKKTNNKNSRTLAVKRAMVRSISVAAAKTPPKPPTNNATNSNDNGKKKKSTHRGHGNVSMRAIARQLGFNSRGSAYRNLKQGEEQRRVIADGKVDGWEMLTDEEARRKLTPELLEAVENWVLERTEKVKDSPCKGNLILHDREGT